MLTIEKNDAESKAAETIERITPRWLRISAAAAYSGLSRSLIYELLNERKIKSHRIRSARVIDRESLDEFLNSQPA